MGRSRLPHGKSLRRRELGRMVEKRCMVRVRPVKQVYHGPICAVGVDVRPLFWPSPKTVGISTTVLRRPIRTSPFPSRDPMERAKQLELDPPRGSHRGRRQPAYMESEVFGRISRNPDRTIDASCLSYYCHGLVYLICTAPLGQKMDLPFSFFHFFSHGAWIHPSKPSHSDLWALGWSRLYHRIRTGGLHFRQKNKGDFQEQT